MFEKLFAESGLSLDRLRALLAVAQAGSIVKAAAEDPVRQSQFSRQIKELEDFFQTHLVERHGKGIRLTPDGRELARISRFFMMGLSNFQRGCLAEGQTYRVGASPTFAAEILSPRLATEFGGTSRARYAIEIVSDNDQLERRLHDLTLDFAITTRGELSRPLQARKLFECGLSVWVPARLHKPREARQRLESRSLPLALANDELVQLPAAALKDYEPALACSSFREARQALLTGKVAALLPDFLCPDTATKTFYEIGFSKPLATRLTYFLAWNPRLLRLNPHATKRRDALTTLLSQPPKTRSGGSRASAL